MHPNGFYCATGEVGDKPKIQVWDVNTMALMCTMRGFHVKGVSRLAFSADGKYLASVGLDDDHSVAIYDWQNCSLVYSEKSSRNHVLGCEFKVNGDLVTCGIKHIYFWSRVRGSYRRHEGMFGKIGKMQTSLCVTGLPDGRTVSGTMSGHLYVWDGRNCKKIIKAHDLAVNVLYACKHGLVSGGKDGKVRICKFNFCSPCWPGIQLLYRPIAQHSTGRGSHSQGLSLR